MLSEAPSESARDASQRVLEALRQRVKTASVSQRGIEEQHDWRRGYLSQVLTGHITLTVHHVLAVVQSLDISASEFFAEALDEPRSWRAIDEISERMSRYDAAFEKLRAKGYLDDEPSR